MKLYLWLVVIVGLVGGGCGTPSQTNQTFVPPGSSHFNLGNHRFKVSTTSRDAQRAFDRGLTLAYAFSHRAAEEEFRKAAALDPQLATAWWGVALVNGPHINFPVVPPQNAAVAWEALTKARALASTASGLERDLIDALSHRYASPQPEDRSPLDRAYAEAMRKVWNNHSENADVATLFAESMMDLRPWDLWTLSGVAQPGTEEIVATLEKALQLNPNQPGAIHLYIHAVEASTNPGRALQPADRLTNLVPGASHLVHMPSHIYVRMGQWKKAAESNQRAMRADLDYRRAYPRPGFYAVYMAHNSHFYAFASMMQGRSEAAMSTARKMIAEIPDDFLKEFGPVIDGFMIFPSEVLMRFGRWEEILKEPEVAPGFPLSGALQKYLRAVALTALGRLEDAEKEAGLFQAARAKVPAEQSFGNNTASNLLEIASHQLQGEMEAKRNHLDEAIRHLRQAVAIQDTLRYDEPPDWIQPARHTLGAVLLTANRAADAEKVYREDLEFYPENGWSLLGLSRALEEQGKSAEAKATQKRFDRAWQDADIKITSSCLCQK